MSKLSSVLIVMLMIAAPAWAERNPRSSEGNRSERSSASQRSESRESSRGNSAQRDDSARRAAESSRQQAEQAARQRAAERAQQAAAERQAAARAQADQRRAAAEAAAQQQQRRASDSRQREAIAAQQRAQAAAAQQRADLASRQREQDATRERAVIQAQRERDDRPDGPGGNGDRVDRTRPAASATTVTHYDHAPVHNDNPPVHNNNTAAHADHDALIAAARGDNRPAAQPYRPPDRRENDRDRHGNDRDHRDYDRDRHHRDRHDHDDHDSHFSFGISIGTGGYYHNAYRCVHGHYYNACSICGHRYRCSHGHAYSACSICGSHYPTSYHTYYDYVYQPNTAVIVAAPQPVIVQEQTVVEQSVEPEPLPDPTLELPDGWSLIRAKDPAEARRAFEKLIEANPNDGLNRIGYAIASALLEDDDAAALAMRDAVATDPASMITLPRDHVIQLHLRSLIGRYQVRAETDAARSDDAFMVAALAYLDQQFALASASVRLAIADGDESDTTTQLRDMIRYQLNYQRDAAKPTLPGAPDGSAPTE